MKSLLILLVTAYLFAGSVASAASIKNYQVTGPIVSLTDTAIVVQKGDEQWEIAREAKTKSDSELKVGQKVTIHYRMVATSVDVKTTGTLSDSAEKSGAAPKTGTKSSGTKAKPE